MPPGIEPLVLFRTLARSPRVFGKIFAGGFLDKSPFSLRQREILIDRTTARLGCEYEWGVHSPCSWQGGASGQSAALVRVQPTPSAGRPMSRR